MSVSEIRALDVDCTYPFDEAAFLIYRAESPHQQQNQAGSLNVWHEVSISSAKVDEQLQKNKNLEFGDEAKWSPEMLNELNAANAICLPACEMLKKMNGVGIHNDNGVNLPDPSTNKVSPPIKPYYW